MERKVRELLSKKGVEAYVPMRRSLRMVNGKKKFVDAPAIAGYVFVLIENEQRLEVLETPYVKAFVRNFGEDAVIPENQIHAMKCMLGQHDYEVEINQDQLVPGEELLVIGGPLTGIKGEFVQIKGKNKVMVRLDHIHTNLLVELPAGLVAKTADYVNLKSDVEALKGSISEDLL